MDEASHMVTAAGQAAAATATKITQASIDDMVRGLRNELEASKVEANIKSLQGNIEGIKFALTANQHQVQNATLAYNLEAQAEQRAEVAAQRRQRIDEQKERLKLVEDKKLQSAERMRLINLSRAADGMSLLTDPNQVDAILSGSVGAKGKETLIAALDAGYILDSQPKTKDGARRSNVSYRGTTPQEIAAYEEKQGISYHPDSKQGQLQAIVRDSILKAEGQLKGAEAAGVLGAKGKGAKPLAADKILDAEFTRLSHGIKEGDENNPLNPPTFKEMFSVAEVKNTRVATLLAPELAEAEVKGTAYPEILKRKLDVLVKNGTIKPAEAAVFSAKFYENALILNNERLQITTITGRPQTEMKAQVDVGRSPGRVAAAETGVAIGGVITAGGAPWLGGAIMGGSAIYGAGEKTKRQINLKDKVEWEAAYAVTLANSRGDLALSDAAKGK
jgi:hypothetical protein